MSHTTDGRFITASIGVCLLLFGCSKDSGVAFREYAEPQPEYSPRLGSGNAFDRYALAALETESKAKKYITKVSFTPGMKQAVVKLLREELTDIAQAQNQRFEFPFRAVYPLEAPRYHAGWRLLGHAMVWNIEDCLRSQNESGAVMWTLIATKFGIHLTAGGAVDGSLGITLCDEARKAILPALPTMQSAQQVRLSSGLKSILNSMPRASIVAENERLNMLKAIDFVQSEFRDRKYAELRDAFGLEVRDAVSYLGRLEHKSRSEQVRYFEEMFKLSDLLFKRYLEMSNKNASQRDKMKEFSLRESGNPSWRFARQFFTSFETFLRMRDRTLARTRLLALEAQLIALKKKGAKLPADLSSFGTELNIDPFTGKSFLYRTEGGEYRLYSAGANFVDDLGETDNQFENPDLSIEK